MRASLEMRWFCNGMLPKAIGQWFGSESLGGYLSPPEEREDLYLLIPSCDYLGVKLRQKNLQDWGRCTSATAGKGKPRSG